MSDLFRDAATSLYQRGFYEGEPGDLTIRMTQVMAVMEELAEVARVMRRWTQTQKPPAPNVIEQEAADVWIAATALLLAQCGNQAERYVRGKLALDNSRGYLHGGNKLRSVPDNPPWE